MFRRYAARTLSSTVLVVLCSCIAASDGGEPLGQTSSASVVTPTSGGPSNNYATYLTTNLITSYSYSPTAVTPLTTASQVAPYLADAAANWNCGSATGAVGLATSSTGYTAPDGYAYQGNYYQWFQSCLAFWHPSPQRCLR